MDYESINDPLVYRRILLTIDEDDNESTIKAFRFAVTLAHDYDAHLGIVSVLENEDINIFDSLTPAKLKEKRTELEKAVNHYVKLAEKIGIKKSRNIADCADLIIAIFDASRKLSKDDYDIIDIIKDRKAIILINKRDIENKKIEKNKLQELNKPIIEISALNREGINDLYKEITNLFKLNEININNEVIITNIRHLDLIRRAKENVINAINTINSNMPIDIISINIKDIIDCLNSITGESTSEDIINDIFSKFCLGK